MKMTYKLELPTTLPPIGEGVWEYEKGRKVFKGRVKKIIRKRKTAVVEVA